MICVAKYVSDEIGTHQFLRNLAVSLHFRNEEHRAKVPELPDKRKNLSCIH